MRFKDRNPAPLSQLDSLMHETYRQLLDLSNRVEAAQNAVKAAANVLSCVTRLILLLMRYRFGLDDENFALLQAFLSLNVADSDEQGWEEMVDAAMTHLLKTSLAKTARDSSASTTTQTRHMTSQVHAMGRLERVFVSSRKTSLLIMLGSVLQSNCRIKMDVMMMPSASDCASTSRFC